MPSCNLTLTPEQYAVTQHEGTECPFANAYWNNHAPGLYVNVVSGEPLETANVVTRTDRLLGLARTEARSTQADSQLGNVFNDGPAEEGGLHFSMNSAALYPGG
jgi:peptide-methionine (R)-S-oxide reductase